MSLIGFYCANVGFFSVSPKFFLRKMQYFFSKAVVWGWLGVLWWCFWQLGVCVWETMVGRRQVWAARVDECFWCLWMGEKEISAECFIYNRLSDRGLGIQAGNPWQEMRTGWSNRTWKREKVLRILLWKRMIRMQVLLQNWNIRKIWKKRWKFYKGK